MSNRLIAMLSVFAAVAAFSPVAHASPHDGAVIAGFLTAAEGDFSGKGVLTTTQNGQDSTYNYDFELKIDASEDTENTFTLESTINGDDGSIHGAHDRMQIQGDSLIYVNNAVATFPTRLISVSATELKFAITIFNNWNGQVYEQITHYTLAGDTLSVSVTTGSNGQTVSDDEFRGSRY